MHYFSKTRVEAFSDGVFAIIVTLLVLEIKVPHVEPLDSVPALRAALLALLPKAISWVVSFLMVCVVWVNHHRLLNQIGTLSHGVFWLNANLLLWCSFVPFPTALLGDYPANPVSAVVFGAVMLLMSFSFSLLRLYLQRRPALLHPAVDARRFGRALAQSLLFGPLLYGAGAAAAFLSPWLALAVFACIPVYFIFFNSQPTELAASALE